jgi:hypothetical protein
MINLRHIKFLAIIIFSLLLSSQSFADKKFDKDLKVLSKFNSFINNKGESYATDVKFNKDKTIIVIYAHGSHGKERSKEKCTRKWNKVPPAIYQLDGVSINSFTVRIYHLCYGVRGWSQFDEDRFWDTYDKNKQDINSVLNLKDKKGVLLVDKTEVATRKKAMKLKVDEFIAKGFNNIVLSGHSAGAWTSLVLKSNFPNQIDGAIVFSPGRSGKFAKAKNPHKGWVNWRNYKNSLIKVDKLDKVLVYVHEKDHYENSKTALSFLSNPRTVKFIDLSDTKCKAKVILGGYHGIALTKCFAEEDPRSKEITKYLEEIF